MSAFRVLLCVCVGLICLGGGGQALAATVSKTAVVQVNTRPDDGTDIPDLFDVGDPLVVSPAAHAVGADASTAAAVDGDRVDFPAAGCGWEPAELFSFAAGELVSSTKLSDDGSGGFRMRQSFSSTAARDRWVAAVNAVSAGSTRWTYDLDTVGEWVGWEGNFSNVSVSGPLEVEFDMSFPTGVAAEPTGLPDGCDPNTGAEYQSSAAFWNSAMSAQPLGAELPNGMYALALTVRRFSYSLGANLGYWFDAQPLQESGSIVSIDSVNVRIHGFRKDSINGDQPSFLLYQVAANGDAISLDSGMFPAGSGFYVGSSNGHVSGSDLVVPVTSFASAEGWLRAGGARLLLAWGATTGERISWDGVSIEVGYSVEEQVVSGGGPVSVAPVHSPAAVSGGSSSVQFVAKGDGIQYSASWGGASVPISSTGVVDLRQLPEGRRVLVVSVVDAGGRTARWEKQIVIDRTPPVLSWRRFAVERTARVSVRDSLSGVAKSAITVRLDRLGPHRLRVQARDRAGNRTVRTVSIVRRINLVDPKKNRDVRVWTPGGSGVFTPGYAPFGIVFGEFGRATLPGGNAFNSQYEPGLVREVQHRLKQFGYQSHQRWSTGTLDGATRTQLRRFQQRHKLTPTGVPDLPTRRALDRRLLQAPRLGCLCR